MNKPAKIALIASGSLGAFVIAFVGFSLMLGTPPHEIRVIGALFPGPAMDEQETVAAITKGPKDQPPRPRVRNAGLGVLDVFRIDSPYSTSELDRLVKDVKRKLGELDQRLRESGERGEELDERASFLDDQYKTLQELRAGLEEWEAELDLRQAEVERDETARKAREEASWKRLSKLFEKGDAREQAGRLKGYGPEDAALILGQLKPVRAQELLEGLSEADWQDYAEAYRLLEEK